MENGASEETFGKDLGLIHEVVVTGRKAGANRAFWTRLAHDQAFFKEVIENFKQRERNELIREIFLPPELQLEKVKQLNNWFDMGFSDEDFIALGEPPAWPKSGEIPVVFLEFFPRESFLENFKFLWFMIESTYQTGFLLNFQISADFLKSWEGTLFESGLRWRVADVGKIMETPIEELRHKEPAENMIGLGVLCMAILFRDWVINLGVKLPRVTLPGIQAQKENHIFTESKYRKHDGTLHYCFVPVLTNERAKRGSSDGVYLELHEIFEGQTWNNIAVPVFLTK